MIVKNVEKKENNVVAFQVDLNQEEFEAAVQTAYLKNKKNISVPGFRKGKAPRVVIEGMYGANVFYDDAIDEMSQSAFSFAVEQESLKTVGRPSCTDVDITDEKTALLSFETAIYPEVTLGQYKGLEVPKEEINITDADVDQYLEEMRKRHGRQVSVERAAKNGDTADIDFEGFDEGIPFEGGKGEGHKLDLGSGQFVPGFEEQVVGMKAGDEKEIDITFPEDYQSELAGKPVVFKVKCNEVIETELPEIDDEFTKDVSEFDTLEEYRTAIKEELEKGRMKAVEEEFAFAAVEAAAENMTCDIPEAMIEERMSLSMQEYDRNLMAQGVRLEEYVRMMGMDMDGFKAMLRPQAIAQIKSDLLFAAIVKEENFEITEDDIAEAVKGMAEAYNTTEEQITKLLPREIMEEDMKKKKANDLILESAIPVAPKAKEEEKAE